jgi:hypothetical protein
MLTLMYWDEDDKNETERKRQRENELRQKKGLPLREEKPLPLPPITPNTEDLNKVLILLEKQIALSVEQGRQLEELNRRVLEQKVVEVVKKEAIRNVVPKKEFKRIDDIDVNVIDTSGIEVVGEAGEIIKGDNITSQIEKLKRLKKRGGG